MRKKLIVAIGIMLMFSIAYSQEGTVVTVTGVGLDRNSAINDAKRKAVEKGLGTFIQSTSEVKDMVLIKDAISTQSTGWVTWDTIIKETPLRDTYEVIMQARVSQKVLEKNVKSLAQWLGGLQFLVFYDPRDVSQENLQYYEYSYSRLNEQLKKREYRYVEKNAFDVFTKTGEIEKLKKDTSEYSYMQKLGATVKAEFTIFINKIEIRDLAIEGFAPGYKVTIHAIAYDNCTAEGFATVVMEGSSANPDKNTGIRSAIDNAIIKGTDGMLFQFNKYMGDWVSTGAVYEVRFYGIDYEDLRPLKNKIKNNPAFGQQLSINDETNYSKWNMTYNSKPDEMLDFILDNAPFLKKTNIYGRLISFKQRPATNNTNNGNK